MTREDREAITRRLEAMYGEAEDNETKEALFYAIEALKEQRPHGEWEAHLDTEYCKCSECKTVVMLEESVRFHFCPNCGADMRKEGEKK